MSGPENIGEKFDEGGKRGRQFWPLLLRFVFIFFSRSSVSLCHPICSLKKIQTPQMMFQILCTEKMYCMKTQRFCRVYISAVIVNKNTFLGIFFDATQKQLINIRIGLEHPKGGAEYAMGQSLAEGDKHRLGAVAVHEGQGPLDILEQGDVGLGDGVQVLQCFLAETAKAATSAEGIASRAPPLT